MATFNVDDDTAVALRRAPGITITMVNQSATDVYFSREPDKLNRSKKGAVPAGMKLAATTGQLQYPNFPGVVWLRAAAQTTIEVVP